MWVSNPHHFLQSPYLTVILQLLPRWQLLLSCSFIHPGFAKTCIYPFSLTPIDSQHLHICSGFSFRAFVEIFPLKRSRSVFLSLSPGRQHLPPLVPRAPVQSVAFVFQPVCALLCHEHAELNQFLFRFACSLFISSWFYHCTGLYWAFTHHLHPNRIFQEYCESPGQEFCT